MLLAREVAALLFQKALDEAVMLRYSAGVSCLYMCGVGSLGPAWPSMEWLHTARRA